MGLKQPCNGFCCKGKGFDGYAAFGSVEFVRAPTFSKPELVFQTGNEAPRKAIRTCFPNHKRRSDTELQVVLFLDLVVDKQVAV